MLKREFEPLPGANSCRRQGKAIVEKEAEGYRVLLPNGAVVQVETPELAEDCIREWFEADIFEHGETGMVGLGQIEWRDEAASELLTALKNVLPLARAYLRHAPGHPAHVKISDAYDAIEKAERRFTKGAAASSLETPKPTGLARWWRSAPRKSDRNERD